jgi:hypothetical protein
MRRLAQALKAALKPKSPERGEIATLHNKTLSPPNIAHISGWFPAASACQRSGFQVW